MKNISNDFQLETVTAMVNPHYFDPDIQAQIQVSSTSYSLALSSILSRFFPHFQLQFEKDSQIELQNFLQVSCSNMLK